MNLDAKFVEVTCDGKAVLVNALHVICVQEGSKETNVKIVLTDRVIYAEEEYAEVKKRLGLAISPRAETLALR